MLYDTEMNFWRREAGRPKMKRTRNDMMREVIDVTNNSAGY